MGLTSARIKERIRITTLTITTTFQGTTIQTVAGPHLGTQTLTWTGIMTGVDHRAGSVATIPSTIVVDRQRPQEGVASIRVLSV